MGVELTELSREGVDGTTSSTSPVVPSGFSALYTSEMSRDCLLPSGGGRLLLTLVIVLADDDVLMMLLRRESEDASVSVREVSDVEDIRFPRRSTNVPDTLGLVGEYVRLIGRAMAASSSKFVLPRRDPVLALDMGREIISLLPRELVLNRRLRLIE